MLISVIGVTGSTNSYWARAGRGGGRAGGEKKERVEGKKSRAGERRTAESCESASVCSCCKSAPLPKCPLCWSERVKVPFSCESALFHKYFTMPFLTPGGNTNLSHQYGQDLVSIALVVVVNVTISIFILHSFLVSF